MNKEISLAIVGATGAVGVEILRVLERRNFPLSQLRLLASPRSAGKTLRFRNKDYPVEVLSESSFAGIDVAIFSAGGGTSQKFAPAAVAAGAIVVDNSSAFRMDENVPLVIPEINPEAAKSHKGIIANPNCTTAVSLMGLYPLHKTFGLQRVFAASYQAVSGSGAQAIEELRQQVDAIVNQREIKKEVYPHQIAFNVIPHVDNFLENGYTREEMKLQFESRKIMDLPELRASVTCVRVPVYRAHSVAITAEFEHPVNLDLARKAITESPGVELEDDPASVSYPMPIDRAGKDNCSVGRLRKDCAAENALTFWISGDQLLKGAALNAVQIAELLL
ncbi:MAG: aspartate-semialdehyde dehydrogenase [Chthoniobacterales bacterium]